MEATLVICTVKKFLQCFLSLEGKGVQSLVRRAEECCKIFKGK